MLGYYCAWFRCYYPAEFITAFLNHAQNDDDIRNGTELAEIYGIKFARPKFGLSRDKYFCSYVDDEPVIAKGVESLKFLNAAAANELYEISQDPSVKTFADVLASIPDGSSITSKHLEILVKMDYFIEFGNSVELSRVLDFFHLLKDGTAKTISRDKVPDKLKSRISPFVDGKKKDGSDAKSYKILDMRGLMNEFADAIFELELPDVDLRVKMQNQLDYMGFIDVATGKPEDRRKLLITDIFPLKSKKTQEVWGYAVQTRSLGSGKTSRLTLKEVRYRFDKFKKNAIIYAKHVSKNNSGYWYLNDYAVIG